MNLRDRDHQKIHKAPYSEEGYYAAENNKESIWNSSHNLRLEIKNNKEWIIDEIWFIYLKTFSISIRCVKNRKMFLVFQNSSTCCKLNIYLHYLIMKN